MDAFDPIPDSTPIDISGLIPQGINSRQEVNLAEAENVRKAVVRYLTARPTKRQAPFTLAWSLRLHQQMFGDVWKWAGTTRTVELNLGVPAYRIPTELQTLFDDLKFWREHPGMDSIEQAARLHHRAVAIHPFLNGNGRWARMLANIYLKQFGSPITMWPEQTLGETSIIRGEYIAAIQSADGGGYEPLIAMHRRYAEK